MGKHIMLDLETFGTGPKALPISIGAVKFDSTKPIDANSDAFHIGIIPQTAKPFGFDIDADTIMWWLDEKMADARRSYMALEKTDIASALTAFLMWMNGTDYELWGNGATFDNVILRHAFEAVTGPGTTPWTFRQDRCYRTMRSLVSPVCEFDVSAYGVAHSALADAMWQARHLQLIFEALGLSL